MDSFDYKVERVKLMLDIMMLKQRVAKEIK